MKDVDKAVLTNVIFRKAQLTLDRQVASSFKDNGLTPMQFAVLDRLYSHGQQRIADLLEGLLATSGNMTLVLKNMEQKGWIVRQQCPHDKRAFLIDLTDQGRALIARVLPEHLASVRQAMSIFTDEELEQLASLLKKFKDL